MPVIEFIADTAAGGDRCIDVAVQGAPVRGQRCMIYCTTMLSPHKGSLPRWNWANRACNLSDGL